MTLQLLQCSLLLFFALGCSSPGADPDETCRDNGDCEIGVECDDNTDCASALCDGICARACDDEDLCPDGQGCRLRPLGAETVAICTVVQDAPADFGDPCSVDVECRGGVCHDGACTELCSSCTTGAICDPAMVGGVSVGLCKWAPVAPVVTSGPFAVPLDGTEEIRLSIPVGLESFTIIVRDTAPGGTRRVGVASLVSPDGEELENGDLDTSDPNPAGIRYPDAATILVPVRDTGAAPTPGTYVLTARIWDIDFDAADPFVPTVGEVLVDVVYEWAGERGGLLDLNLFLSPGTAVPLDASAPFLADTLAVVSTQFGGAGVTLGEITVAGLPAMYDRVDSTDVAREIARTVSAPGRFGAAVNVFLVDRIEFDNAFGFTGGSPSPPGQFGLASSGVLVDVGSDPIDTGIVLSHEIGHFLGLRHTTAFNGDGSVFGTDPISDTPECPDAGAQCPDRANLMFPSIDFGEQQSLTAGQLDVISRNPTLYELVRPDLCSLSPARDITVLRRAAGILPESGQTSGSCGGAGGEAVHVLRVQQATTLNFEATGDVALYLRSADCADGPELGCSSDGQLSVAVEPGEYFLFVDSEDRGGPYVITLPPD